MRPNGPITWAFLAGLFSIAFSSAVAQSQDANLLTADLVQEPATPRSVTGQIIVKPRADAGIIGALPATEALSFGLRSSPTRTSGGELVYEFNTNVLLELPNAEALQTRVNQVVDSLNARDDIEYAQPNWIVQPHAEPNDTHYNKQWHYWDNGTGAKQSPGGINLPTAWETNKGDQSVVVAILDTGLLSAHPDVASSGNTIAGYDMISDPAIGNDGDGRDADATDPGDAVTANECYSGSPARASSWHGTHVSGTVGAVATNNATGVAGGNWVASIQPVRVLGKCGGTTVDINDAIRWAAGLPVPGVPANQTPAKVINMSLGGGYACSSSPSTQQAIDDAVTAGAVVVVSAGNSATDAANSSPASCNNVITVAASDARGHLASRYSNYGSTVEIMAPGGDVQRDDNGDGFADGVLSTVDNSYAFYNGTSMAAPHVSAVAALLLSEDASLSPADVLAKIQTNAIARSAAECPKPCGAGLLNAAFKTAEEKPAQKGFEYAAKFICGTREDFREKGTIAYDTIVNIRNPGPKDIKFEKRLELAIPPGSQKPGKTFDVSMDSLPVRHTLAADCDDVIRRVFQGNPPAGFLDGYLVIRSPGSLDVTSLYRSRAQTDNQAVNEDIDIERVHERLLSE